VTLGWDKEKLAGDLLFRQVPGTQEMLGNAPPPGNIKPETEALWLRIENPIERWLGE
jgi:hypothetical protein